MWSSQYIETLLLRAVEIVIIFLLERGYVARNATVTKRVPSLDVGGQELVNKISPRFSSTIK